LDIVVKNLVLSYEVLAKKSVKLNESYFSLLKVYEQILFAPALLVELEKADISPFKVIESMRQDQKNIIEEFDKITDLITKAQKLFINHPEAKELTATLQDCQTMSQFVKNIDLNKIQTMFAEINL
jgi:hypothetical protein